MADYELERHYALLDLSKEVQRQMLKIIRKCDSTRMYEEWVKSLCSLNSALGLAGVNVLRESPLQVCRELSSLEEMILKLPSAYQIEMNQCIGSFARKYGQLLIEGVPGLHQETARIIGQSFLRAVPLSKEALASVSMALLEPEEKK